MGRKASNIQRPKRWDQPFDDSISDDDVDQLLSLAPFNRMDPTRFSTAISLRGLLLNDTRLVDCHDGDLVIREGDYGHSAFMVIGGEVQVCLRSLPTEILGKGQVAKKSWMQSLAQLWTNPRIAEVRDVEKLHTDNSLGVRADQQGTRIFLQDVPHVLDDVGTATIRAGEIFGELAALTRTPRTASVVSRGTKTTLLEIRWQGLRDLIRRDPALKEHIDQIYRQNSLNVHLRETPILANLSDEGISRIADAAIFETYGQFDWQQKFKASNVKDHTDQIRSEPLIVKQDDYSDGLILVRNGFARVSRNSGIGEKTTSYLGKGSVFGLREMNHNANSTDLIGWQNSLRAIGYVDILRIPTMIVETEILPHLIPSPADYSQQELNQIAAALTGQPSESIEPELDPEIIETSLLEFLVEHRFVNGTKTMMINLDRCTRCDDCVRACAATHENNPRFVRQGPKYDNLMITNACMHCVDPVCMIGCPTGAIGRDADSGNVSINEKSCIGCGTCANSCPYENIKMVEIRNLAGKPVLDSEGSLPILKATKCDFCSQQLTGPACQNACPHDALVRIDMSQVEKLGSFLAK